MLNYSYKHLNNIQKGSFAEAYAKMAFTLEGFEVYTTDYDDRGVDFVIRNAEGRYYSVQVKSMTANGNPFVYAKSFQPSGEFLVCAVHLVEGKVPELYLASGTDWETEKECLHYNPGGGNAGAYYELRLSKKYSASLETHRFEAYVERLRGGNLASPDRSRAVKPNGDPVIFTGLLTHPKTSW